MLDRMIGCRPTVWDFSSGPLVTVESPIHLSTLIAKGNVRLDAHSRENYFSINIVYTTKQWSQLCAAAGHWSSRTCKYFFSSLFSRSVAGGRS